MSLLVNNVLLSEVNLKSEWSAQDLVDAILYHEKIQSVAVENVVSDGIKNILTHLHDFIWRIINNIKTIATRLFTSMKRSELEVVLDSHKLAVIRLEKASYSNLYKASIPAYHFSEPPSVIAAKVSNMFTSLNLLSRLDKLIGKYDEFSSSIRSRNFTKCIDLIGEIDQLNIVSSVKDIESYLKSTVVVHTIANTTTIGAVFHSTQEIISAYKAILNDSKEFDNVAKVVKKIDQLILVFSKLVDNLNSAQEGGVDIGSLKQLSPTIGASVDMCETYSVLVREYHHLEHWIANVLRIAIKHL